MQNKISYLNGQSSVIVDDHQRIGGMGLGKKGQGVISDEENSNSTVGIMGSVGSDSSSSNFVFVQGDNTVARYDEDASDDKDLNEEAQIALVRSDAESSYVSLAAENIRKHEVSMEHDPLAESIEGLHFAQVEFEREVQKWRDIGKDDQSIFNDTIYEVLELKDARIMELEFALSSAGINTELEDCLMKILQADVERVVLTRATKRLTEGPLREIKHNLQHKTVPPQNVQVMKKQDWNLETEENLERLQNRVCRFTSCFMIQLVLLLVTLYLKFSAQNVEVVPT